MAALAVSPLASRRRAAATLGVVTAVGVGFNLARLALRLDTGPVLVSLAAFWVLLTIAAGLAILLRLSRAEVGLVRPDLKRSAAGVALAVAVFAGAAWLTAPAVRVPGGSQLALGLLFFGLGTAPAEELLFRGVLQPELARTIGAGSAIALTSLAFAAAHLPVYGWSSLAISTAAGLLLGWLRWWTGSILPAAVVHVAADLAILWL